MNKYFSVSFLAIATVLLACQFANGQSDSKLANDNSTKAAIKKVLNDQAECWNKKDLDGFMKSYWKSEQLTFSGGGKTTRGWQATMDNYKKSYPPEKMGRLNFEKLEITVLSPESALVLGNWQLDFDGEKKGGNFSLVLKKQNKKWMIIHDHTSTLNPEESN